MPTNDPRTPDGRAAAAPRLPGLMIVPRPLRRHLQRQIVTLLSRGAPAVGHLRKDSAMMEAINLRDKLSKFSDHWQPRVVGQFNGHDLMVVKVQGEFVWHEHEATDDFFLVLKGQLTIRMHDGDVTLGPGELFVVPKGVQHCPCAAEEAHLLLIEPSGTPNTGDAATAAPRHLA